jgi:hypothetical protein
MPLIVKRVAARRCRGYRTAATRQVVAARKYEINDHPDPAW